MTFMETGLPATSLPVVSGGHTKLPAAYKGIMLNTGSNTFIPEEKIREIRASVSIVGVISDYVSLKKKGANYQGLCPFHQEKTASFSVNEEKNFFYCFGCHASGDVFTFLMKQENISFSEAAKILARRSGITLPEKPLSPQQIKKQSEKEALFEINRQAARLYHQLLMEDPRAENARKYLENRDIRPETIKGFGLGFAPDSWDTLVKIFQARREKLSGAVKTGLLVKKETGRYYDRFRNRIIFPILNIAGNVVGFGGRMIDTGEPKYLNSPESEIYSKRHTLYGLPNAVREIQSREKVVIVEGYLDVLSLHQAGVQNSVAPLGTALTEHQIRILRRYTRNIVTVFDADPSGEKAMVRSLEPFLANNIAPRLVLLPEQEDPDSFVRKNGGAAFIEKTDRAGYLLDFVVEKIINKNQIVTPRGRIEACDEIVPLLNKITDDMERDIYIQKICRRMDLKEEHLRNRLDGGKPQKEFKGTQNRVSETASASGKNAEQLILQLMAYHSEVIEIVDHSSFLDEFTDPDIKQVCTLILTEYKQTGEVSLSDMMAKIERQDWKKIIAEPLRENSLAGEPVKVLEDCIKTIRLKKNIRQREKITTLLKQAEASKDEKLSTKYLAESQKLLREKQEILRLVINT